MNKSIEDLVKMWNDIYVREAEGINFELLSSIKELKKKYPVYLFTDTLDTHDEYNASRGIYDKFTTVFKSHVERLSKITDEAFLNVLRKTSLQANECIFIDDFSANTDRAAALGFKAILYVNNEELFKDLQKLGIEV